MAEGGHFVEREEARVLQADRLQPLKGLHRQHGEQAEISGELGLDVGHRSRNKQAQLALFQIMQIEIRPAADSGNLRQIKLLRLFKSIGPGMAFVVATETAFHHARRIRDRAAEIVDAPHS